MNQETSTLDAGGDKDDLTGGGSPATSISSIFSEQDPPRNSPFLFSQSSPLSASSVFQRPDFLSTTMPDSETSSRSSWDGSASKETTAEKLEKFRLRNKRTQSPSTSESDEDTNDTDTVVRKSEEKYKVRGIDAPRGRIANIRRESNCSVDNEAAHERMIKASQQVSTGFDDFSLEPDRSSPIVSHADYRRRAPSFSSIGEPISIVTNAFIPHSCSPSPTRLPEALKQCYSPSTQQMVRPNISYSPSPKGSPSQSPTRHRSKILRSASPILLTPRHSLKRKMTSLDIELDSKRAFVQRNNTSPLVNEKIFPYPVVTLPDSNVEFASPSFSVPHSPGSMSDTSRNGNNLNGSSSNSRDETILSKMDNTDVSIQDAEKISEENDIDMAEITIKEINNCNGDTTSDAVEQLIMDAANASLPDDDDDDF